MEQTIPEVSFDTAKDLWDRLSATRNIAHDLDSIIYRGHANAEWSLIPTILRPDTVKLLEEIWGPATTADRQVAMEYALLCEFVECCNSVGIRIPNEAWENKPHMIHCQYFPSTWPIPESGKEQDIFLKIMAMSQLHGLPTRLLDWTTNPYVATRFAVSDALHMREEGLLGGNQKLAIWQLNRSKFAPGMPLLRVYRPSRAISENLAAQFGLFTIHPLRGQKGQPTIDCDLEAELATLSDPPIQKFTVPVSEIPQLYELCEQRGFTPARLFPSVDGVTKSVMDKLRYSSAFDPVLDS